MSTFYLEISRFTCTISGTVVSALCASAAGAYAVAHEPGAGSTIHENTSINADRFVN